MSERFQMLLANGGGGLEMHAQVVARPFPKVRSAAEHRDVVATLDHAAPDLLDACLESAVGGGHASRADERDAHREIQASWSAAALSSRSGCGRCPGRPSRAPKAAPGRCQTGAARRSRRACNPLARSGPSPEAARPPARCPGERRKGWWPARVAWPGPPA